MTALDDLIQATKDVASERPDHIYKDMYGCVYATSMSEDGNEALEEAIPSCLLGHALVRIGFSADELLDVDGTFEENMDEFRGNSAWREYFLDGLTEIEFDKKVEWLQAVQTYQDHGTSWGDAVKNAGVC